MEKVKIIIINGPNLNILGKRDEKFYGARNFDQIFKELEDMIVNENAELSYYQSNHEGLIIDKIQECTGKIDMIIINPGALTHYSYSLHDALLDSGIPVIEVHLSNIFNREDWRSKSVISPAVMGIISGFGEDSYKIALKYGLEYTNSK